MSAYVTVQLDIFSNQEAEHDQQLPVTALSVTVLIPKTERWVWPGFVHH